jgi:hypothetical protein
MNVERVPLVLVEFAMVLAMVKEELELDRVSLDVELQ